MLTFLVILVPALAVGAFAQLGKGRVGVVYVALALVLEGIAYLLIATLYDWSGRDLYLGAGHEIAAIAGLAGAGLLGLIVASLPRVSRSRA